MPIFDGLGRSLRWLRERQVKRQYQVAAGAGITKAMLSAYETGKQKPSLDTLEKILDALACDLNDLHNALQIVNGRPERMRNAGAGGDYWRAAGKTGDSAPSGPGLYEILGAEEPLPQQEEQAMSERLGGFQKLLRYMHGRIPNAPATAPAASTTHLPTPGAPATAGPIAGSAASSAPAASGAPAAPTESSAEGSSPPPRPDPAGRGGS